MEHNILLAKLANFGIRCIVYKNNWFKDYLYDRKQYVCISGTNSECGKITCGVPQRSVLGPLLFLLYVNDIGSSLPNTSIKLFADDTNLFIFNNIVEDLQVDAMDIILRLNNWFVANKLSLSLDKTIFGASDADKVKINLKIDNVILQKVDCTKYLGVFINSNLSWENHIDYIYNKIIKFVGIFYKIRYKLNFDISNDMLCICTFTSDLWY